MTEIARLRRALATLWPGLSPVQAATMAEGLAQVHAIVVDELQRRSRRQDELGGLRRTDAR